MTTTTSYGTWANHGDGGLTVEQNVHESFGSEGPDGFDVDAIVSEYREAINAALPEGVSLCGDEFIGPYNAADCDFSNHPVNKDGMLNIREIIDGVDFWEIAEKHQQTHTLTVIRGDAGPDANGEGFGLAGIDVPDEVHTWLRNNGVREDDPDVWVLVTPIGENPGRLANVIAQRGVTATQS